MEESEKNVSGYEYDNSTTSSTTSSTTPNRAQIARGYNRRGDKRGRRALRSIFSEKILGNELAEISFQGWAQRNNIPLMKTQAGKISKRAIKDATMKNYIESLNEDQIKISGLSTGDVSLLKGKSQEIRAQQIVMPSLLNLVAQKGSSVDIMPDPSFGVKKTVEQKSQGTDLNIAEYAKATGMDLYEAAALAQVSQREMGAGTTIEANPVIKSELKDIEEGLFRDNMIREVNAGLTGLEENPVIHMRDRQVSFKNILEEPAEEKYPSDPQPILTQDETLNGPDDEFRHADPNDDREIMNTGIRKLAENNQYSGDQKDFMSRVDANKATRGKIERGQLDTMLGKNAPRNEGDKREDEEEKYEQEGIGGGYGDEEGDDLGDVRVREGGQNMREIIENEMEKRLVQPKGSWVGARSSAWTNPTTDQKITQGLSQSQALAYLRKTGIPYRLPSRSYANNSVGLIRNSNRSIILAVNQLEP